MSAKALARIFVNIASYRDPDCQWTVKDMYEKAAHPERVFAGICWQFIKGEDDHCFEVPYPRPKQVRVHEMDAREAKGVCSARYLIQKELWQDEEFTLQIDSHMRFEQDWDDKLFEMWEQCGSEKAVLTCYPPGFTPPDKLQRDWIFGMAAKEFDANGILLMHGKPGFRTSALPDKPIPGAFASACMCFGPSSINQDVPYDPNIYFFGEEISLAVRLWTHGYDLYHPNQLVIFHNWDRTQRKTHFDDHKEWPAHNLRSFARVRHLLGTEVSSDKEVIRDLDKFGLGNERSLLEYEAYSGVSFGSKTISEWALRGEYHPYHAHSTVEDERRIFVGISSFRDRQCQWAVKDLFEKAVNPDRIFVGICWQFDEKEDQDCFQVSTRPDQVRVIPVDWRESRGQIWGAEQSQLLWEDEEYRLQLDTSMRFVPGWDEQLVRRESAGRIIQNLDHYRERIQAPAQPKPSVQPPVGEGRHQPRKVFESKQVMVFDDFLPEDIYQRVYHYALKTDYEYINTKGKISRAWHVQDGFPLRSLMNLFYYAPGEKKPEGNYVYPTKTELDLFIDQVLSLQPKVEYLTGRQELDWGHLTATAWIYPPGTGLAMHDDGSGVYSGAYVYFLNPMWRAHWGGQLIMMDEEANRRVHDYRKANDQMDFYHLQWLNSNGLDDLIMEHGFGKCIMPKKNRIVFIANDAYHMVTRVNEQAGDNVRMSLAGFFNRKKPTKNDGNY